MNICITGALGHIGSALIRNIPASLADKVYLVDNFLTQRYASLFGLPNGVNYSFHEIDILSEDIRPIIKDSDVLIHLAAVTNAEASFHNSELVEKINKKGLENVAKICAECGCSLAFPSSTSVYGVQEGLVDENCEEEDLKPQSPYAESKLYGEKLLARLSKEKGLKFVIFRLATIFGYSIGMRFHTAVNKFIWQASLGQDITVWKTAMNQKRPYCDLRDAISAFNYVVENNVFDGEIYNIVTVNLTVADIIACIKRYIPGLKVKFVESTIMNQLSYNVSNKKSTGKGFRYAGNLDVSIKESVQKMMNINVSSPKINL
jgi:nucleoside-diphosphate-sugar epimerase